MRFGPALRLTNPPQPLRREWSLSFQLYLCLVRERWVPRIGIGRALPFTFITFIRCRTLHLHFFLSDMTLGQHALLAPQHNYRLHDEG